MKLKTLLISAQVVLITHTLKMTNCGSVDIKHFDKKIPSYDIHGMK